MNNALENLELLKEKMSNGDDRFLEVINDWEADIKEKSRISELGKNQVVKELVANLKKLIANINDTLRDVKECNRDELFLQRDCWLWLVNFFTEADESLEQISKDIEDNLKTN